MSEQRPVLLVVDDRPDNLFIIEQLVNEYLPQSIIYTATNADSAIRKARAHLPDGILSDIQMPGMNGIELCRHLKADPVTQSIPIVLITAQKDELNLRVQGLDAGADDFITRPIYNLELTARIKVMLRIKFMQDALNVANQNLEERILERTAELMATNERMQEEIEQRLRTEEVVRQNNRYLRIANALTKSTIVAKSEKELIGEVCRIFVEDAGYLMVWFGYVQHDAKKSIVPVAQYGDEDDYLDSIELTWVDEEIGRGPIGTAVRQMSPTICSDTYNDPCFLPWKEAAQQRGYRSCLALPLVDENECFGTLTVYSSSMGSFTIEEVDFLTVSTRELLYGIKVLRNSSEKRQIEQEKATIEKRLNQAQKMEAIGTLAGGIAHDFNNILSSILGYSNLIMETLPKDSEGHDYIQQVIKAGKRATDLARQILLFSRQSGDDHCKPVRIQPVVKEALKFLRSIIPSTILIRQEIDESCGIINADPTQLHQVIMNLCTNAKYAMQEQGGVLEVNLKPVDLKQHPYGSFVCLEVIDSGCGMHQEVKDRIFDPFYTTKIIGEGTGMGLAVVHGIIEKYNGFIRVSSKVNVGTTFQVYFPMLTKVENTVTQEVSAKQIQGGIESILVVDDEAPLLDLYTQILEKLGYTITSYGSAVEALEEFTNNPDKYDLILTDMTMPRMTGAQLALETMKIRMNVPVILCTGFSDQIDKEKTLSMGLKGYLPKPFVRADLALLIREVLDTK